MLAPMVGVVPAFDEKMSITKVYTNSTQNAVFVEAHSIESNITIYEADFNDKNGNLISRLPIEPNVEIIEGQTKSIMINYMLPAGNYTVAIHSKNGSNFVSSEFSIK